MKRRFAALLTAALVASTMAVLTASSPASADVCAGNGQASTAPLLYPVGVPTVGTGGVTFPATHTVGSWAVNITIGGCLPSVTPFNALGTLQGYCGHSTGTGADDRGHLVAWLSVGSFLILTNAVTGVANAVPNVGQSCLTGATNFLVTGAIHRANCLTQTLQTGLTTIPGQHHLASGFHVTTPPINVHHSVHVCVAAGTLP